MSTKVKKLMTQVTNAYLEPEELAELAAEVLNETDCDNKVCDVFFKKLNDNNKFEIVARADDISLDEDDNDELEEAIPH